MGNGDHRDAEVERLKDEPKGYFLLVRQNEDTGPTLDIVLMLRKITAKWRHLFAITVLGALIAAAIAMQLPDTYRAQVIVTPVNQSDRGGLGALSDRFGGLAALAGVDIGGGTTEEAFATLSSDGFTRDFLLTEDLLPILFKDQWDEQAKAWRSKENQPTLEKAVGLFNKEIRSVSQDRKSGLITIGVKWRTPELAANWANRFVELANERLRAEAIRDAEQSVEYLKKELQKTGVVELQQAIYRVMESQINKAMLANIQRQYSFRVIDPAVPPEIRATPNRVQIVLIGAFLAVFLTIVGLFAFYAIKERSGATGTNR